MGASRSNSKSKILYRSPEQTKIKSENEKTKLVEKQCVDSASIKCASAQRIPR